jgi:hypothetical protein
MCYLIFLPLRIVRLVHKGKIKDKKFRAKYGGIYEVYKEDSLKTAAFEVVVIAKKFLIAVALVFLGTWPIA